MGENWIEGGIYKRLILSQDREFKRGTEREKEKRGGEIGCGEGGALFGDLKDRSLRKTNREKVKFNLLDLEVGGQILEIDGEVVHYNSL